MRDLESPVRSRLKSLARFSHCFKGTIADTMTMDHNPDSRAPEPPGAEEGVFDAQLSFPAPFVGAPEPLRTIVKRDGREAPFDRTKIADAIFQAAQSIGGTDRDRAESLASGVAIYLAKTLKGSVPSAEQVQDAVEKVLIEMGHARTALAFARFRDKRARIRRLRQGDMRSLLNELEEARAGGTAGRTGDTESLFVRTSDERIVEWQRERIVDALVRETGMEPAHANLIAIEVEGQIMAADVRPLTASLIRELVDAKLVDHGLDEFRRKHSRLGVPLFDAEQIICAPNRGESERVYDPAASDLALAERVKREYALTQVFSPETADAHRSGELHIHDLGYVDRLHAWTQTPALIAQFGLSGTGFNRLGRPPARAETFASQLGDFARSLGNHVAGAVSIDAPNLFMAPFAEDLDDEALRYVARMLLMGLPRPALQGMRFQAELLLPWAAPEALRKIPAFGPGGVRAQRRYGDYAEMAQRVGEAFLDAARQDHPDDSANSPGAAQAILTIVVTEHLFRSRGHGDWLRKAAEHALLGGRIDVLLVRDEPSKTPGVLWRPRVATLGKATINLPRAALGAQDEAALTEQLAKLVRLAAQAHRDKQRFIERLLSFKDLGPLSLLQTRHDGRWLLDIEQAQAFVGVMGLNECVQVLTGMELHESPDALEAGVRIMGVVRDLCREEGRRLGLRLRPAHANGHRLAARFAMLDLQAFPEAAPDAVKSDPVTQDVFYTPGASMASDHGCTPAERLRVDGWFHDLVPDGAVACVRLGRTEASPESIADFIQKAFYRTQARRLALMR